MNLSYSLPKRSTRLNIRLLAALTVLVFLNLAILQIRSTFQSPHGIYDSVQTISAAALSPAPQAVPVPTPSSANWQHVVPQKSGTPTPAVFQPTPRE